MVFTILTIVFTPVFTPTDSFHGFRWLCVLVAVPPAHVKTCTALGREHELVQMWVMPKSTEHVQHETMCSSRCLQHDVLGISSD